MKLITRMFNVTQLVSPNRQEFTSDVPTPEGGVSAALRRALFTQAKAGDMAGIEALFISAQLAGANVDMIVGAADETGMTALHWAAREGHDQLARYLVRDLRADVLLPDFQGRVAADHAHEMCWIQLRDTLERLALAKHAFARTLQVRERVSDREKMREIERERLCA